MRLIGPRPRSIVLGLLLAAAVLAAPRTGPAEVSADDWRDIQGRLQKAVQAGSPDTGYSDVALLVPDVVTDDSVRAVELLYKVIKACAYDGDVYREVRRGLAEEMKNEKALALVAKFAKTHSDWRLQVLSLEVAADRKVPEIQDILIKLVGSREDAVAITAIQRIGEAPWNEGVDAVLERMSGLEAKRGVVWEYCRSALARVTGVDRNSAASYTVVWAQVKAGRTAPPQTGQADESRGTMLFGTAITCDRIVFIIDTSGSMEAVDPARGPVRGTSQQGDDATEERQRMRRAKAELAKVVEALGNRIEFNIVAYSSGVRPWSDSGLKKATPQNKASAKAFVAELGPDGTTHTDEALRWAYENCLDAYCFYLLSDGDPTHYGGDPPSDRDRIIESIYSMADEMKLTRKTQVAIHTLGFVGANVEFMRTLAQKTGGTYKDIE